MITEKPLYARAAELLKLLATPLHLACMRAPAGSPAAEEFCQHWYALRSIAGRVELSKSICLTETNWAELKAALKLAHDHSHFGDPLAATEGVNDPTDCWCSVSDQVVELVSVIAAYDQNVRRVSAA